MLTRAPSPAAATALALAPEGVGRAASINWGRRPIKNGEGDHEGDHEGDQKVIMGEVASYELRMAIAEGDARGSQGRGGPR